MPSHRIDRVVRQIIAAVERELRAAGDPARAAQEQRYLKSTRVHLGVTVPGIRRIAKQVPPLDHDTLIAVRRPCFRGHIPRSNI